MWIPISQCKRSLNFGPSRPWPQSLPAIVWQGELLAGFERTAGDAYVVEGNLGNILSELYADLSLPELARWIGLAPAYSSQILDAFALADREETRASLAILEKAPLAFQDWVTNKKVALRELEVLRLFTKDNQRERLLKLIPHIRASKSQGVEILELGLELSELERLPEFEESGLTPDLLIKQWKRLRYPVATEKDLQRETLIKKLPWPAHTQVRWVRQGDTSGVEVRFTLQNPNDLKKQIQALRHIDENGEIWSPPAKPS